MDRWSVMWPLTIGAIACLLTALVGAYLGTLASAGLLSNYLMPYGAAAVLALGIALRRPGLVTTSSTLLLVNFLLAVRTLGPAELPWFITPLIGAGIIAVMQLGWWAIELTVPCHGQQDVCLPRIGEIILTSAAAGTLIVALLPVAHFSLANGLIFVFLGAGLVLCFMGATILYAAFAAARAGVRPREAKRLFPLRPSRSTPVRTQHGLWPIPPIGRRLRAAPFQPVRRISRQSLVVHGLWAFIVLLLVFLLGSTLAPSTSRVLDSGAGVITTLISVNLARAYVYEALIAAGVISSLLRRVLLFAVQPARRPDQLGRRPFELSGAPPEWTQIVEACHGATAAAAPNPALTLIVESLSDKLQQPRGASTATSDRATTQVVSTEHATSASLSRRPRASESPPVVSLGSTLDRLEASSDA